MSGDQGKVSLVLWNSQTLAKATFHDGAETGESLLPPQQLNNKVETLFLLSLSVRIAMILAAKAPFWKLMVTGPVDGTPPAITV